MNSLLTPSLQAGSTHRGFSMRALVWVSFLGGPFSALMFGGLNASKWRKLQTDWPLFALFALISALATVGLGLQTALDVRMTRLVLRGLGPCIAGLLWLRYIRSFKAQEYSNLPEESPWRAGILCVVLGGLVLFLFGLLGHLFR